MVSVMEIAAVLWGCEGRHLQRVDQGDRSTRCRSGERELLARNVRSMTFLTVLLWISQEMRTLDSTLFHPLIDDLEAQAHVPPQ